MGAVEDVSAGWLIRNRPSGETAYYWLKTPSGTRLSDNRRVSDQFRDCSIWLEGNCV